MERPEQKYRRAVVAVEGDDGAVGYQYGWTRDVQATMDRQASEDLGGRWGDPEHRTIVEWVGEVRFSARYPTPDEFSAALPPGQRALPEGRGSAAGLVATVPRP